MDSDSPNTAESESQDESPLKLPLFIPGSGQSPIDIAGYQTSDAAALEFSYQSDALCAVIDSDSLQVWFPSDNTITVGPRTYELKQAHIHTPSEHSVDGESFAAELHLVHQSASDSDLAVVALLYQLGPSDPVIEKMLKATPKDDEVTRNDVGINAADYMPAKSASYRYNGSLTTPPYPEGVSWFVIQTAATISKDQIDRFQEITGGPNNRPLQPLIARSIIAVG